MSEALMTTTQTLVSTSDATSEIAIFARLIQANNGNLARPLARYVLTIGFDESDQARMHDLAVRNQEGRLSSAEKKELRNYVRAGHMLALLQSKARKSLKKKNAH
jgi:hypothetical protein